MHTPGQYSRKTTQQEGNRDYTASNSGILTLIGPFSPYASLTVVATRQTAPDEALTARIPTPQLETLSQTTRGRLASGIDCEIGRHIPPHFIQIRNIDPW